MFVTRFCLALSNAKAKNMVDALLNDLWDFGV